ncbi:hypothetical protein [Winogradskyella sp.]|uniref:hypothetical protein n=1 Tax=Winogradskyella sp. TaxID=1883156 RepID=UPI00261716A8|nr:hypothetical protein [uncultured Winogradskyella sp.]
MPHFVRYLLAIIVCITFVFCNNKSKTINSETKLDTIDTIGIDSIIYEQTPIRLKSIVDSIIKINVLEFEHITIAGLKSKNYRNFEVLKKTASALELVILTNNKNEVVATYSAWVLADKSYGDLKSIFKRFLNQTRTVKTHSGCIISEGHIASKLYHRYWNNIKDRENDNILKELDSIILFQNEPDWLLLHRALENRLYEKPFKKRISELAFKNTNKEALFYLNNWHKAEYYEELKYNLLKYLKETEFKNTGTSDYFRTVKELLRFNNPIINDQIVEKMKKDKHWHHDPEKFRSILDHHGIYYFNWSSI